MFASNVDTRYRLIQPKLGYKSDCLSGINKL